MTGFTKGDGTTDDADAFEKAVASGKNVFVTATRALRVWLMTLKSSRSNRACALSLSANRHLKPALDIYRGLSAPSEIIDGVSDGMSAGPPRIVALNQSAKLPSNDGVGHSRLRDALLYPSADPKADF